MGVHDLWKLIGPCGHRISLDTIARRKLAVDVSIWLNQFVKYLPTSQPHLLGLLRRLCKLHFFHIKPVFVFDGPAPMLKKRTLQYRRKIRAKQQDSFERMAERILLEQLKLKSLKDLRKKLEKPKQKTGSVSDSPVKSGADDDVTILDEQEMKSIRDIAANTLARLDEVKEDTKEDNEIDDDAEMQMLCGLQPEEYAAGFASPEEIDYRQSHTKADSAKADRAVEVILPSSDEEDESAPLQIYDAINYELPESGELDADVLASLPISVQYEMLDQHRQHHHTLSMRKYAAVKNDMKAFSSLQMQSFLKHVQFNQEIDRKRQEMNAAHSQNGRQRLAGDSRKEFLYVAHTEQDKKKERDAEQTEELRRTHNARVQLDRASHSYIADHIRSMKEKASLVWACHDCGIRNEDEPGERLHICHHCGAIRKEAAYDGSMFGPMESLKNLPPSIGHSPAEHVLLPQSQSVSYDTAYWKCDTCAFLNEPTLNTCEICHEQRIGHTKDAALHVTVKKQETEVLVNDTPSVKDEKQKLSSTPVKDIRVGKKTSPSILSPGPLLLSTKESKQAKVARRPRMRLKTMSVEDIVWFDEEGNEQASEPQPTPVPAKSEPQVTKIERDAICISEDDLAEQSSRVSTSAATRSRSRVAPPISMDADWLEAPEPQDEKPGAEDDDAELQLALQLSLAVSQPSMISSPIVESDDVQMDIVHAADDVDFDEDVWEDEESVEPPVVQTVLPVNNEAVVVLLTGDLTVSPSLQATLQPTSETDQELASPVLDNHAIKDVIVMQNEQPHVILSHVDHKPFDPPSSPEAELSRKQEPSEMNQSSFSQLAKQSSQSQQPSSEQHDDVLAPGSVSGSVSPVSQIDHGSVTSAPSAAASIAPSINASHSASPSNDSSFTEDMYESKYDEESKYDDQFDDQQTDVDMSHHIEIPLVAMPAPVVSKSVVKQRAEKAAVVDVSIDSDHDEPEFMSLSAEANSDRKILPASSTRPARSVDPAVNTSDTSTFWSSSAQNPSNFVDPAEAERLSNLAAESHALQSNLTSERARTERQAQQVTTAMFDECKQLLTLFGCPYVESPAEAEAQCAELEMIGLVDGIVTEDSDVFLFGATEVYRNIFDAKKYAERYKTGEVEAKLGLTRESMISLALLLGSDYTAGIHGIGIVNAMEIINAFHIPGQRNAGLVAFREWCFADTTELRPAMPVLEQEPPDETDDARHARELRNAEIVKAYRTQLFKFKHRNIRRVWHITRDFPSDEIRRGYEEPDVDSSREAFSWSKPRWDDIIEFLRDKFRSDHDSRISMSNRTSHDDDEDEWLAMVNGLRKSWEEEEERSRNAGPVQNRLDMYFDENDQFAEIRSRRIHQAVRGLTSKSTLALLRETEMEDGAQDGQRGRGCGRGRGRSKKSSTRGSQSRKRRATNSDQEEEDDEIWRNDSIESIDDPEAVEAMERIEKQISLEARTKRTKKRQRG